MISASTKSSFESNAKMVLKSVGYKKLENESFDETSITKDNITSLLGLSNDNYESINIIKEDSNTIISIVGKNKWNGLVACGTLHNMKVATSLSDCGSDLILPVITLNGDAIVSINQGDTYVDLGATATDNKDGDITSKITVTSNVNPNVPGTYTVTYTITDMSGNKGTATRTVTVIDTVAPVISFGTNGNSTYAKERSTTITVTDAGGLAIYRYLWNTKTTTPAESSISTPFLNGSSQNTPNGLTGSYYLWVLAKDNAGNTTIVRSNVFNIDNTKPVITLNGNSTVNVVKGSSYIDQGAKATDNIDGDITNNIVVTNNVDTNSLGTYTVRYNVSDSSGNTATTVTRTVIVSTYAGPTYIDSKGVNGPVLATGMTPIKWNGSSWVDTTVTDPNWYSYTTTDKKWANARTADGSMWVWIPRYIYKIPTANWHTSTAGTIEIQFSMGTDDTRGGTVSIDTNPGVTSSKGLFTYHKGFTFGSTKLTGIWVAKFEPTGTTSAIKIVPGAASIRNQKIDNMFTAARAMETNSSYGWGTSGNGIDTHMMKNVEWGTVAYLTQSAYGKNAEVWMNNSSTYITGCAGTSASPTAYSGCQYSYSTANGMQASTTGNIYGIYDMSGGAWEYTAAYVNNDNANLAINGSVIVNVASKYKDVYTAVDTVADNYLWSAFMKGDAIYETSSSGSDSTTAWYGDYAYMMATSSPWCVRGGSILDSGTTGPGLFYFARLPGIAYDSGTFRVVLLVGNGM